MKVQAASESLKSSQILFEWAEAACKMSQQAAEAIRVAEQGEMKRKREWRNNIPTGKLFQQMIETKLLEVSRSALNH